MNDPELNDDDLLLPKELEELLRSAEQAPEMDSDFDASVLTRCHEELSKGKVVWFPEWMKWSGAVAAVLVLFFSVRSGRSPVSPDGAPTSIHAEAPAVDQLLERPNILAAFAVAISIADGETDLSAQDANSDGLVDQLDVEWLAARAVQLEEGI